MNKKEIIFTLNVKNKKVAELFEKILLDVENLKTKYSSLEISKLDISVFENEKKVILDEISSLKAIITADESTLKKLQDIIKDLEGIETSILRRLQKIENLLIGGGNHQASEIKYFQLIYFNEDDFKITHTLNKPKMDCNIFIKDTIARKSDIPDVSNYATKDFVNESVKDKANSDTVLKIQEQINYPNQPNQSFFQTIDLEKNIENGLIGLKTLFDSFFTQRHYFKFDLSFNFDTSQGNIYKTEITYKNNSIFIKFIPNGLPLKIGEKNYNKITWMEYSNDYDKNFEILSWKNMIDDSHIEESNSLLDNTILNALKNQVQITNIREGFGLHYGKVNWG